jgi:hypothetical protein
MPATLDRKRLDIKSPIQVRGLRARGTRPAMTSFG